MCDNTTAIYCFIDDFLKQSRHQEDIRVEVTDAEVITIAMTAMLHFGGNFEKSRLVLLELGLIKRLLSRSRLSRRINRLADLIYLLFHQLGSVLKSLHCQSRYVLDSFPVSVCDNIRIGRCRIVREEQYRGKMSSKRRFFYSVRVQYWQRATAFRWSFVFCREVVRICRSWRSWHSIFLNWRNCLSMANTTFTNGKIICWKLKI